LPCWVSRMWVVCPVEWAECELFALLSEQNVSCLMVVWWLFALLSEQNVSCLSCWVSRMWVVWWLFDGCLSCWVSRMWVVCPVEWAECGLFDGCLSCWVSRMWIVWWLFVLLSEQNVDCLMVVCPVEWAEYGLFVLLSEQNVDCSVVVCPLYFTLPSPFLSLCCYLNAALPVWFVWWSYDFFVIRLRNIFPLKYKTPTFMWVTIKMSE